MSLFGNLKNEGLEEAQDRLGGFQALETDIYTGKITMAYAGQSQSGARNVTLIFAHDGKEYRETVYVTNSKGENFFLNKEDKTKKVPLPGFTIIDDLCLITTGKPLCEQEAEEKVVKIYDFEQKKELPKSVPVLIELLGQTVSLGIVKQIENKQVKNSAGEYEATAETRTINFIDKVYHTESKMTVTEGKAGKTQGEFWDAWLNRNKGQERDKRTIKDGEAGAAGRPSRAPNTPPQAGAAAPARKSLFGK